VRFGGRAALPDPVLASLDRPALRGARARGASAARCVSGKGGNSRKYSRMATPQTEAPGALAAAKEALDCACPAPVQCASPAF